MELIINLCNFRHPAGLLSERHSLSETSDTVIFSADLLLWLFCTGLPVLDIVSVIVFRNTTDLLCIGIRLGLQRYFLCLLQYTLSSPEERSFSCRKSLLAPLIGVPLCAFYCTFGDILSNLLWCGMMILVSYRSIHGLVYAETQTGKGRNLRYFHIGILCYVAVEYTLWTSGCFWPGDSIFSPYCWCDLLLTFCLFGLLPATGKAVRT